MTTDGDQLMLAVPGASGHLVRTGYGSGHASVTAWSLGSARLALLDVAFPAVADAEAEDGCIVFTAMLRARPGGVWNGVAVDPGLTFVYPSGSSHHARDMDGLSFALAAVPMAAFATAAQTLGIDPATAAKKSTYDSSLWAMLSLLMPSMRGEVPDPFSWERLLEASVRTACAPDAPISLRERTRRSVDADLVHTAIDYLEQSPTWRVPLLVLCRHLSVSERRLELAFIRLLGVGPHTYMQRRALQAAHRALRTARPDRDRVATIATRLGFPHLGRFADAYRTVYGENPSATLRR
ncbi:hypothetical protein GCM10027568_04170 [Humibacter soli]